MQKLEQRSALGGSFTAPLFVSFSDQPSARAILPGHHSEMRKLEREADAQFYQRVYQAYVEVCGLQQRESSELSDEELQFLVASATPELAYQLRTQGMLSDESLIEFLPRSHQSQEGNEHAT